MFFPKKYHEFGIVKSVCSTPSIFRLQSLDGENWRKFEGKPGTIMFRKSFCSEYNKREVQQTLNYPLLELPNIRAPSDLIG